MKKQYFNPQTAQMPVCSIKMLCSSPATDDPKAMDPYDAI